MIVNASSKRLTRWSNGKPKARVLGLVPAGAEAQDQAAAADLVDRRGLLREHRRRVEARRGDERPQADPAGRGGDRGEHRPALPRPARVGDPRPAVQQVVADPDGVEADVLDPAGHRQLLRPAHDALHLGQLDARP